MGKRPSLLPVQCTHCHSKIPHPFFAYLCRSPDRVTTTRSGRKIIQRFVPYIGLSRHPELRVRSHNRDKALITGAKGTTKGAPNWKIVAQYGPFWSHGVQFKKEARITSRKFVSRFLCTGIHAQRWGVNTYLQDKALGAALYEEHRVVLEKHPPAYTENEKRILHYLRLRSGTIIDKNTTYTYKGVRRH